MAEETITYRPQLDTSDLANQLQQVRSQIDQAMATQIFRSSPIDPQPSSFAFPGQQFVSAAGTTVSSAEQAVLQASTDLGGAFSTVVNSSRLGSFAFPGQQFVSAAGTTVSSAEQAVLQASTDLGGAFSTVVNSSRLGYQKFTIDAQTAALATPLTWPSMAPPSNESWFPNFNERRGPFSQLLEAATLWGHDPRMSITRGAYSRIVDNQMQDRGLEMGVEGGMSLLGGAVGTAFGGILGGMAGDWLGSKVGGAIHTAFASTLGYDYANAGMARTFARNTSWRFLSGRFNRADAMDIGNAASQMQRSDETLGYRVGNSDVQKLMSEFTEMGGFDLVRSAEEYKTKLKDLVDNHRKMIQALRTSEKEFLGAYKQWDQMGLLKMDATANIGFQIAGQALAAGYNPAELMQFGTQVREMVRGTAIPGATAYLGGMSAITAVQSSLAAGMPTTLVEQFGGKEQMAAQIARTGYNWGLSQSGFTQFAAQAAMGPQWNAMGATPTQTIAAAVGFIKSPNEYAQMMGALPNIVGQQSPEVLFGQQGVQYIKEMEMLRLPINDLTYRYYAGNIKGMGAENADLQYQFMTNWKSTNVMGNMLKEQIAALPGGWDTVVDKFQRGVSGLLGLERIGRSASRVSENIGTWTSEFTGNISRSVFGGAWTLDTTTTQVGPYITAAERAGAERAVGEHFLITNAGNGGFKRQSDWSQSEFSPSTNKWLAENIGTEEGAKQFFLAARGKDPETRRLWSGNKGAMTAMEEVARDKHASELETRYRKAETGYTETDARKYADMLIKAKSTPITDTAIQNARDAVLSVVEKVRGVATQNEGTAARMGVPLATAQERIVGEFADKLTSKDQTLLAVSEAYDMSPKDFSNKYGAGSEAFQNWAVANKDLRDKQKQFKNTAWASWAPEIPEIKTLLGVHSDASKMTSEDLEALVGITQKKDPGIAVAGMTAEQRAAIGKTMSSSSLGARAQRIEDTMKTLTERFASSAEVGDKVGAVQDYLSAVKGGTRDPQIETSRLTQQLLRLFATGEAKVQTVTRKPK